MENTNDKFNLSSAQLCEIINDAFELGKTYATDELDSCRSINTRKVPTYTNADKWNEFIEKNGGHTLHSGEAKFEILYEHVQNIICERFSRTVAFD